MKKEEEAGSPKALYVTGTMNKTFAILLFWGLQIEYSTICMTKAGWFGYKSIEDSYQLGQYKY